MVATTEPATTIDGKRSLKTKRPIKMFSPGPKQNRLGEALNITTEKHGSGRNVSAFGRIGVTAWRYPSRH
jgi:hypothetical protein